MATQEPRLAKPLEHCRGEGVQSAFEFLLRVSTAIAM
jgi:hypothetical protein